MAIDLVKGLKASVMVSGAAVLLVVEDGGSSLYSWLAVLTVLLLLELISQVLGGFEQITNGIGLLLFVW